MSHSLRLPTSWILVGVIAIGGLAALLGAASQAIWTDQETVGTNAFSTGSVDLNTVPTDTLLTLGTAKPGDSNPTSGGAQLEVLNDGTLDFIYAVSVGTSPATALDTEMKLEIKGIDVTTPGVPCDDFDGAVLYALGNLTGVSGKLIGDPATGSQAGDRTLTAGNSEFLCFQVTLPSGAPNTAQGLTTTATFTFDAEQVP